MKIIEEAWRAYESRVIPPGSPVVQRVESRNAFYAGAMSAVYGLMGNLRGDPDTVTEDNVAVMNGLMAELKAFEVELQARASRGEMS